MKVILHLGIPKTGSTSLQLGLAEFRQKLLDEGFLYPELGNGHPDFHHVMTAFFENQECLWPNLLKRFGSLENCIAAAKRFLYDARKHAEKEGCHTIIFSSELLFPGDCNRDAYKLHRYLGDLSWNIETVVYVREPAGLYKSSLQQRSKSGNFLKPIDLQPVRRGLELIEEVFGRRPIVRAFDRNQLTNGDILQDFYSEILGLQHLAPELPRLNENSSMSAEATTALLEIKKILSSLGHSQKKMSIAVREFRMFVDPTNSLTPLTLKPDLVDAIRNSAEEYIWLRDKFGIEFNELDYDNINPETKADLTKFDKPEKIFDYDQIKLDWLISNILGNSQAPKI